MGKLRLDFDGLVVESFATGEERPGGGTVHGRAEQPTRYGCNTDEASCNILDTRCGQTCGGAAMESCGGGCYTMAVDGCFTGGACVASEGCVLSEGCESADGLC